MTMVMPASTWAQVKVMYTEYDTETKTLTFEYGVKPKGTDTKKVYDVPNNPTDPTIYPDWLAYKKSITKVVFDESFKDARPTSCAHWFDDCSNLTFINIKYLNTEEVTNMMFMFDGCSGLTSLNLSNFNTAKVTDMECMFNNCSSLY